MQHKATHQPSTSWAEESALILYVGQGQLLKPKNNPGTWVNYRRCAPSARVLSVMKENDLVYLVMVAVRDISEGEQVF